MPGRIAKLGGFLKRHGKGIAGGFRKPGSQLRSMGQEIRGAFGGKKSDPLGNLTARRTGTRLGNLGRTIGGMGEIAGFTDAVIAKPLTTMAFAPLAAIGYPALKLGGLGLKGGFSAAKGIGKQGLSSGAAVLGTPRGRTAALAFGAMAGSGYLARGAMSSHAERTEQRWDRIRDPANAMNMSQSLHYHHRRR